MNDLTSGRGYCGAKGSRAGRDLGTPRSATTKEMKKMKMRTSALVGGQKNPACALVDRRLRDLSQAVDAKRYLEKGIKGW